MPMEYAGIRGTSAFRVNTETDAKSAAVFGKITLDKLGISVYDNKAVRYD